MNGGNNLLRILDPKLGLLRVKNLFPNDICEGMITITTKKKKIILKQYQNGVTGMLCFFLP